MHYALNALQLFMIIDREPLLLSDLVFTIEVEHFDKHICWFRTSHKFDNVKSCISSSCAFYFGGRCNDIHVLYLCRSSRLENI